MIIELNPLKWFQAKRPVASVVEAAPQVQEVSKAAKAEESIMATAPVVVDPAIPVVVAPVVAPVVGVPRLSFIKRLGLLFIHGVQKSIAVVQNEAPAVEKIALVAGTLAGVGSEVQAAENTFNQMFGEVVQVEQVATAVGASAGNGAQKLAVAIPQIEQILLANPLFKGKTITDLAKWNKAVSDISGAIYDLGNAVTAEPVAAVVK